MDNKAKKRGKFYIFGQFILRLFFFPLFRLKIIGKENIPQDGSLLLCCNHVSMKDPMILGIVQNRQIFYMAKEELFRNPIVSAVIRGAGAFPVRRGTGGTDALQEGYDLLRENAVVGVFIEGHRSETGELQRPKTGAALLAYRTGATVLPACITAENGKIPSPFKKTVVCFGKPIPAEQLQMQDDSSMQLRRASRLIMDQIRSLREESIEMLGLSAPKTGGEEKS